MAASVLEKHTNKDYLALLDIGVGKGLTSQPFRNTKQPLYHGPRFV